MVVMDTAFRDTSRHSLSLRLLASLLCVASLVLLLKSKQTTQRAVGTGSVSQSISYSDTSGFLFLVYGNILAAAYGVIVSVFLIPSVFRGSSGKAGCSSKCARWTIFVLDQAVAYILLSAVGAAIEVLYLIDRGMDKTEWSALCPAFGFFCHRITAAVVTGFIAVILLAVLSVLSAQSLFHNFYSRALYTSNMYRSSLT